MEEILNVDKTGFVNKAIAGENNEIFGLFEENPADVRETKSFVDGLLESYTKDEMDKRAIVTNIIDLLTTIPLSDSDFVFATYLKLEELGVDMEVIFDQKYSLTNAE